MSEITLESGELAYENEGLLWKAGEGCTSTFNDFVAARSRWMEIYHETRWNPWRIGELQPESDHVAGIMREWVRAEPDHRMMTDQEVSDWRAEMDREFEAQHEAEDARWARDKTRYSAEREQARYALLEREAMRAHLDRDLEGYRSGAQFPGMRPELRAKKIAELESDRQRNEDEIASLSAVVGDPEDVVDAQGKLPSDRRPLDRVGYDVYRRFKVEELRQAIAEHPDRVGEATDRTQKSLLGSALRRMERQLTALLAVREPTPEEMCSECDTPKQQHLDGRDAFDSKSCPRWPMRAARMQRVWENLRLVSERLKPVDPEPPKPTPLATLPGNLPIAEVIERLSELQQDHPDAVIKRGRANRWELWPQY